MAKMGSTAAVFAKMGNPWVTEREGVKDFGRSLIEDPDVDLATMMRSGDIRQAPKRPVFVDPPIASPVTNDRRRIVNILAKLHRELRANTVTVHTKPLPIKPSTVAVKRASKASHGYWLYVKLADGTETEVERQGGRTSMIAFKRASARKNTVCVELWSNATGDCIQRYQKRPGRGH